MMTRSTTWVFTAWALLSAIGTWIILKLVNAVAGLRVSPEGEATGLDLSRRARLFVKWT